MKIEVLLVGRPKARFFTQALSHYLNQLKSLALMTITPLKPEPILQDSSPAQIHRAEADRILSRLKTGSLTMVLDRSGKPLSSE